MPEHGATVQLRDQNGSAHRSEVLQIHRDLPGTLLLSSPADRPADRPFDPGTRLLVSWPEENSYWVLPVLLVELRNTDGQSVLVAEVDDDAWREERRQYARSALDATVAIDFATPDVEGNPAPVASRPNSLTCPRSRCVASSPRITAIGSSRTSRCWCG